jgi:hypothetical protein
MSRSLPEVRSLASALLNGMVASPGVGTQSQAAERVLQGLSERISPLVGSGGFHLLLQRALRRTCAEHPWLDALQIDPGTPWKLPGMAEAARDVPPEEAEAAAQALLAELIGLLARFLGADMAVRMVRQSFPEITRGGDTGSGAEETTNE